MAILSWPNTDILDLMPVETAPFALHRQRQYSKGADGTVYRADLAPPLWMCTITSVPMVHSLAQQVLALLQASEDDLSTFFVWDISLPAPQADPNGTILGAATPTIASIDSSNRMVTIQALPANYTLTRGDYISVLRASDSKRQLFKVVDPTVVASSAGITPLFQLSPYIRTGMAVNDTVYLLKPAVEMVIQPGTLKVASQDNLFTTLSFQAIEAP